MSRVGFVHAWRTVAAWPPELARRLEGDAGWRLELLSRARVTPERAVAGSPARRLASSPPGGRGWVQEGGVKCVVLRDLASGVTARRFHGLPRWPWSGRAIALRGRVAPSPAGRWRRSRGGGRVGRARCGRLWKTPASRTAPRLSTGARGFATQTWQVVESFALPGHSLPAHLLPPRPPPRRSPVTAQLAWRVPWWRSAQRVRGFHPARVRGPPGSRVCAWLAPRQGLPGPLPLQLLLVELPWPRRVPPRLLTPRAAPIAWQDSQSASPGPFPRWLAPGSSPPAATRGPVARGAGVSGLGSCTAPRPLVPDRWLWADACPPWLLRRLW